MDTVLWVVIPCYNEEEVLPMTAGLFREELRKLIQAGKISPDSRILYVNDGSKDRTWEIIEELAAQDSCFLGICQSRNRGHQNAVLAGLMEAKEYADITISIDCDGQDDIAAMERMVDAYHEGCEVVYGVRSSRKSDTVFKRATARGFYRFLNRMGAEVRGGGLRPRRLPAGQQARSGGICRLQGGQPVSSGDVPARGL